MIDENLQPRVSWLHCLHSIVGLDVYSVYTYLLLFKKNNMFVFFAKFRVSEPP